MSGFDTSIPITSIFPLLRVMEVSGMYVDRRFKEPNPLAFYLNILSTDVLNFNSVSQARRTVEFLWAKRHELAYRLRSRFMRRKELDLEAGGQQGLIAASHF